MTTNSALEDGVQQGTRDHDVFYSETADQAYKTSNMPRWVRAAVKKMSQLSHLSENWDSYGARAVDEFLIQRVGEQISLTEAVSLPEPEVVPTSEGGVQLEWDLDSCALELEFCPDGSVLYLYEDRQAPDEDDGELSPDGFLLDHLRILLARLA